MRYRPTGRRLLSGAGVLTSAALMTAAALLPAAVAYADTVRDGQWHLGYLRVADAHAQSQGDGVTVAVLDSGVDPNHPDLAGSVLPGVSAIGTTDAVRSDPDGRGTALAGLIAGHGHGAGGTEGVLGLAPKAKILPVVVAGGSTNVIGEEAARVARGIRLALERGATVICVGRGVPDSPLLHDAVDAALRADAVIVATDGNRPGEQIDPYPAAYQGVVAAVPLTRAETVTVSSPSGRALGLAVPGEDVLTTNTGGGYRIDAGNASAGLLAGAAALVRAAYPKLKADEVVHRLTMTAVDAGTPGRDETYGYGRLDLVAALTRPVPPLHPSPAQAAPAPAAASGAPGAVNPPSRHPRGVLGWLVVIPLLAVLGGLAWYAIEAERTLPAQPRT